MLDRVAQACQAEKVTFEENIWRKWGINSADIGDVELSTKEQDPGAAVSPHQCVRNNQDARSAAIETTRDFSTAHNTCITDMNTWV